MIQPLVARLVVRTVVLCTISALAAAPALAVKRRAFVTSIAGTGNLGLWPGAAGATALDKADAICRARAAAGGLPNAATYRAWLSTSTTDAYCHVQGVSGKKADACGGAALPGGGPWYLANGITNFSGTLDELTGPERILYRPVMLDENLDEVAAGDQTRSGPERSPTAWRRLLLLRPGPPPPPASWEPMAMRCARLASGRIRAPTTATAAAAPPLPRARGQRGHDSRLEPGFAGLRLLGDRQRGHVHLARRGGCHRARRRRQRLPQSRRRGAPSGAAVVHRLALRQPTGCGGPLDLEWTVPPRRRLLDRELQGRSPGRLGRQQHPCLRERQLRGRSPVYRVDGDGCRRHESGTACDDWTSNRAGPPWVLSGDSTRCPHRGVDELHHQSVRRHATRLYCFSNTLTLFWDGFENGSRSRWSSSVP